MTKDIDIIHIFFASDDKFTLPLTNAISSILRNANEIDKHFFHILDKDISQKHKTKIENLKKIKDFDIEYIKIDDNLFTECPLTKECSHIPIQTYYRYLIPQLKPDLDKVLYLDCDILVVSSLQTLWDIDLKDTYCGVVEEMYLKTQSDAKRLCVKSYFNAGILLINNKKWVAEKVNIQLFENTQKLYKENNLIWQDQDVLNYVFKNNVTWINPKFNLQQHCHDNYTYSQYSKDDISEAQKNTIIIHYNTGAKPWSKAYRGSFKKKEYYNEMYKNKFFLELFLLSLKYLSRFCFSVHKKKKNGYINKTKTIFGFIKIKTKTVEKLFLSMGRGCHTAMMLNKMGYRKSSYPMDWIIPDNTTSEENSMKKRFEFLINGFIDFFRKEDLIFYPEINDGRCIKCVNKNTNFIFWHDFLKDVAPNKQYYSINKKYCRRASRLIKHLKSVKEINLIYMENTWDHFNEVKNEVDNELLNTLVIKLKEKYPNKNIRFYYFINDDKYSINEYKKEIYSENIIKFYSNHKYTYNNEPLGTILSIEKSFNNEFGEENA